jgi:hypothetical protein
MGELKIFQLRDGNIVFDLYAFFSVLLLVLVIKGKMF